MPIRFSLVNSETGADPDTWADPPLIKTGKSAKMGKFDNIEYDKVKEIYFEELEKYNHTYRCVDVGCGTSDISRIKFNSNGKFYFDTNKKQITDGLKSGSCKAELEPENLLTIISDIGEGEKIRLISTFSSIDKVLLFLRCLYFDLFGRALEPEEVILVHKVQIAKISPEPTIDILTLASIIESSSDQVSTIKNQTIDSISSFYKNNIAIKEYFKEQRTPNSDEISDEVPKIYVKTYQLIKLRKYKEAFKNITSIQKQYIKNMDSNINVMEYNLYSILCYMLCGIENLSISLSVELLKLLKLP